LRVRLETKTEKSAVREMIKQLKKPFDECNNLKNNCIETNKLTNKYVKKNFNSSILLADLGLFIEIKRNMYRNPL
jgi:hypothetical protein